MKCALLFIRVHYREDASLHAIFIFAAIDIENTLGQSDMIMTTYYVLFCTKPFFKTNFVLNKLHLHLFIFFINELPGLINKKQR